MGPDSANVIYLDIVWTVTSNRDVSEVRIREVKSGYDYYGYTPDTSDGAATWKLISGRVWEELKSDGIGQVASLTMGKSVAAGDATTIRSLSRWRS